MATALLARTFEELQVGDAQSTRGRTVTEADIVGWCSLTGDWFVLHSDAVAAAKSPFGRRIAPGMMVWAYGAGLGVPPDSATIMANYGSDHLRYTAPTYIGDTIHLELEVLGKEDRGPKSGIVEFRWDIINQNGDPVCVSRVKVLMAKGSA